MRSFLTAVLLLTVSAAFGAAQDKPRPDGKYDVQKCTPKVLSHGPERKTSEKFVRKGEKSTGYSPIVAFEILESGDVADPFLKRSSGFANVDNFALTWIGETKYNKRPGCGVIETQAVVTIDWR